MAEETEIEEPIGRARGLWSGTITFGLVSVPVNLFPANRSSRVSLRMLSPSGHPLARRYFGQSGSSEVDRSEIVRAYETEDGELVPVTDEEMESLAPDKTRDIDLRRFVPAGAVDPFLFERAYFLAPAGESTKAYRLLAAAMEDTNRAGIATFVMRGKEYLVAIFAEGGILRAETLRFPDEIRPIEELDLPAIDPPAARVAKMKKAIAKLKDDSLDEQELRDAYAEKLLALVKRKAKRNEDVIEADEAEEPEGDVIDLMEVLKRSLAGTDAAAKQPKRAPKRAASKSAASDLADMSKEDLYERAKEMDIPGRSGMTKAQLIRALERSA